LTLTSMPGEGCHVTINLPLRPDREGGPYEPENSHRR
jgi:hypothetical protein